MVNGMTNLVAQAVRKMELPSWLPSRELSSWTEPTTPRRSVDGCRVSCAKTKAVIPGAAHGGAVPDVEHAESARWLRALPMESRLLRWIACSDFGLLHDRFIKAKKPWPENSTFACWWQTTVDRVFLCVGEVARASTSSHLSCHKRVVLSPCAQQTHRLAPPAVQDETSARWWRWAPCAPC